MASFTIHSVDEELKRSLGLRGSGVPQDDSREFCGVWSDQERRAFNARQQENSRIDPEEWS